ncbi:MAG: SDR family NAD(P)-dependent oxidoreductase [Acidobacteriota bacterium]
MKLLLSAIPGALAAALLNALLFMTASGLGVFGPEVIARVAGQPLALPPVLAASIAGVLGATLLRAALGLILRRTRARWTFIGISLAFLILSFASPLAGLEGAGLAEVAVLDLMHLVAFLCAMAAVEWGTRPTWRWGREPFASRAVTAPKICLVTGATGGIGAAVGTQLAELGWRVVGLGRSETKARALERRADDLPGEITVLTGDLSLVAEADRLAVEAGALAAPGGFSALVHAVGTLKPASELTREGIDENISTSWLSRVVVTDAVALAAEARIVNVAAAESGRLPSRFKVVPSGPADLGTGMTAHGQAQLANDLWTAGLARRGASAWGYGPGAVDTEIRREMPKVIRRLMRPLFWAETRRPEDAGADILRLLLDSSLPKSGFASRTGPFKHDSFVHDATSQDVVRRLAEKLVARARGASDRKCDEPVGDAGHSA